MTDARQKHDRPITPPTQTRSPQYRYWRALARRMVEPVTVQSEPISRRGRALAWLLVTLLLLVATALLLVLIFDKPGDTRYAFYLPLTVGLLLVLALAFSFNRQGHYLPAAWLTVACMIIGTWGSVAFDRNILQGDFVPLVYIALSIFVSSLLLPVRVTFYFTVVQFIALLLLPLVTPATENINWPSLLAFIFFTSALGIFTNVIHEKNLAQIELQARQLRELSLRDPLTGLYNRRYLEETLDRELLRAKRKQTELGVMLIDVDYLKSFNDTHGHGAGDAVLITVSQVLQGLVRGGDIICRFAGDEFVLILPDAMLAVTRERAEIICKVVRSQQISYAERILGPITLSIGVAVYPAHGDSSQLLMRAADIALYRAKNLGRDQVVVCEETERPLTTA